jgi:hypothetical protein
MQEVGRTDNFLMFEPSMNPVFDKFPISEIIQRDGHTPGKVSLTYIYLIFASPG